MPSNLASDETFHLIMGRNILDDTNWTIEKSNQSEEDDLNLSSILDKSDDDDSNDNSKEKIKKCKLCLYSTIKKFNMERHFEVKHHINVYVTNGKNNLKVKPILKNTPSINIIPTDISVMIAAKNITP